MNTTVGAGAGLLLGSLDTFAKPVSTAPATAGFSLMIMGTNWGFDGTIDAFCAKAKKAGYDGIEVWWPADEKDRSELFEALHKHDLKVGYLVGSWETQYAKHWEIFQQHLVAAADSKPVYINCHSGKDYFTPEQNKGFFEFGLKTAAKSGTPIYHETHRSRILYSAPVARQFMEAIPGLRLTLDISHWCNVHESLLQDQPETVALALSRTDHIHSRVGHAESPQVSDPRAPEWASAVAAHFAWWDKVVEIKKAEGKRLTILTEFGPPDYMPTVPYTHLPVANQWDINVHMMETLRKRYA